jgi:hypothetical protein
MQVCYANMVDFSAIINIEENTAIYALKQILEGKFKHKKNPYTIFTIDRERRDTDSLQ